MSLTARSTRVEVVIVKLLREVIPHNFAKREIRPDMSLRAELGIDSLGKVALAFRLQQELGVDLTQFSGSVHDLKTVQDLFNAAAALMTEPR